MRGFDDMLTRERRLPLRSELDACCPFPLRIRHRTGHASLLNTAAFELLSDIPLSARVEPDDSGTPVMLIGVESWLNALSGRPLRPVLLEGLKLAGQLFQEQGIDRIWDATPRDGHSVKEFRGLLEESGFPVDVRCMQDPMEAGFVGTHLKLFPEKLGGLLGKVIRTAHARGMPVAIHVASEEELEAALSALESSSGCGKPDRLEHVPLVSHEQARRIARIRATVVSHPGWLVSRRDKYRLTLTSKQRAALFPFRMLVETGVDLAFSSDAPIESPNPAIWQQVAIEREDQQSISPCQARVAACGGTLWEAPAHDSRSGIAHVPAFELQASSNHPTLSHMPP